jgi:hypothetical protein
MAKQLAALLGGGLDLKALAEMLRRQGRGQDTILAHITPQEAALLKSRGGAGTMNPTTGLPEFEDGGFLGGYEDMAPAEQQGLDNQVFSPETVSQPIDMSNAFIYSAPADTMEPAQTQPQFEPAMTRSFTPQLPQMPNEFVGPQQVRDFKQEAIDQGAAPGRSFEDMLKTGAKQVLGTREGLAGLGTAAALFQARQAGQQARRMQQELSQIGAPNRALGQEMIARGQRGELTPVQMQQMAALDARQKQQLAQRGLTSGTAQQQQQARMQEMQQRGAQDLIDQGIKIAGIGDQYQAAAIRAGYAADQATRDMLNTTLTNLYRTIYGNVATPETTSKTPPPRG